MMPPMPPAPGGQPRPLFDSGPSGPQSFKDLVESRARDLGVAFMPVPNKKTRNDKMVYWFGPLHIYIDRDVVFVDKKRTGLWEPIGLSDLVQLSIRGAS